MCAPVILRSLVVPHLHLHGMVSVLSSASSFCKEEVTCELFVDFILSPHRWTFQHNSTQS